MQCSCGFYHVSPSRPRQKHSFCCPDRPHGVPPAPPNWNGHTYDNPTPETSFLKTIPKPKLCDIMSKSKLYDKNIPMNKPGRSRVYHRNHLLKLVNMLRFCIEHQTIPTRNSPLHELCNHALKGFKP